MFTVLEEKLEYPSNLEESVRKKAVKVPISKIGNLAMTVQGPFKKKNM
jgi:hypothetical protein